VPLTTVNGVAEAARYLSGKTKSETPTVPVLVIVAVTV
jgi:hypothetical protein